MDIYEKLKKLKELDKVYVRFAGTIGKCDNSDYITIPTLNIQKGNMYVIADYGWYRTIARDGEDNNPFPKDELFHAGDILIALESSKFLVYEKSNWLYLNCGKKEEDDKKIKSFISYPFIDFVDKDAITIHEKILEAFSSVKSVLDIVDKDYIVNEEWNNSSLLQKFNGDTINFLMKRIKLLSSADCVYFCKGWNNDDICKYEYLIAKRLDKKIVIYPEI